MINRSRKKSTHSMVTRSITKNINHCVKLPDVLRSYLLQFLTTKEAVRLSAVSSLFSNSNDTKHYHYWKDKLIAAGCDQQLLEMVFKTGSVLNYKNLYYSQIRIAKDQTVKLNQLWELLCLSGEVSAVEYAIEQNFMNAETTNTWGGTPLLLTAYSGSAKAMDRVLQINGLDPFVRTTSGCNVAHFAVFSGNIAAIERASQIKGLDFKARTADGLNVFHIAVLSNNPEALFLLRKLNSSHNMDLNIYQPNNEGCNVNGYIDYYAMTHFLKTAFINALTKPIEEKEEEKIQPIKRLRIR